MAWEELRELGLTVRPIEQWPGARTPEHARAHSPFKAGWQVTVRDLLRELRALDAKQTVLNLAVTDADLRVDGLPRANARLSDAGVVVAFDSMHGPLRYACDRFWSWQENLRAVALGLEALRKVSRYGIATDGQQYRGYRALGGHDPRVRPRGAHGGGGGERGGPPLAGRPHPAHPKALKARTRTWAAAPRRSRRYGWLCACCSSRQAPAASPTRTFAFADTIRLERRDPTPAAHRPWAAPDARGRRPRFTGCDCAGFAKEERMRRAVLALVVLACALAIPPRSASARVVGQVYLPACRAIHGPVFCTALDHRRTIRALRIRQRAEMVRTHARVHIGHRLSTWDVDKLARMNRYERRVLKHLEAKPSYPTLIERAATDEALAIRIAADRYGLSYWGMRRVGGCESTGDASGPRPLPLGHERVVSRTVPARPERARQLPPRRMGQRSGERARRRAHGRRRRQLGPVVVWLGVLLSTRSRRELGSRLRARGGHPRKRRKGRGMGEETERTTEVERETSERTTETEQPAAPAAEPADGEEADSGDA
jgi:hypothetical protein